MAGLNLPTYLKGEDTPTSETTPTIQVEETKE
jgi:hypothetical protein